VNHQTDDRPAMTKSSILQPKHDTCVPPVISVIDTATDLVAQSIESLQDVLCDVRRAPETTTVWGLPLACVTYHQTVDLVDRLIARRKPAFFITANVHYAMLSAGDSRLQALNQRAAFIVADGMPLVWYSRCSGRPLPERVAGSDLIYLLCLRASQRRYRVFLLGGSPGVADEAAARLQARYPGLHIVGVESPPFRDQSDDEDAALVERIRAATPDLLFVAFGQPKGELWLDRNCERLGVPACVQIGATLDFVAGRVRRAPQWVQRLGLEWAYRMFKEPLRLAPRYARNGLFLLRATLGDLWRAVGRTRS
jgi:N-acetylglucosaminyldiphosphoundecaprenol N-acetyl-beta-D-mannosaminyltransferase